MQNLKTKVWYQLLSALLPRRAASNKGRIHLSKKTVGLTLTFGVLVKAFRELFVCFGTEGVIFEAVEMDTLLSVLLM